MDNNIYRIILLKSLNWKELVKLTECKKFYNIVNHYVVWKNIFEKEFPEHIEMIQDKNWLGIKNIFKDLWINGTYFYTPTLIYEEDSSYYIEGVNKNVKIVKEICFEGDSLLILHEKTDHKRTNEKYIAYLEYKTFIKKYPSIFYNNLKYNVTIIYPHGKTVSDFIFVCTEIKLFEDSIELIN